MEKRALGADRLKAIFNALLLALIVVGSSSAHNNNNNNDNDEILDYNDPRCQRQRRSVDDEPHVANVASNIQMNGGGISFSLPVPIPDGPGSLKPDLAIEYSNSGPEGILGIGFKISATSVITRCPKTIAQDGKTEGVKMDDTDAFCLDGTRLILIKGEQGKPSAEYRTEIESFSRITSRGRVANGPESFSVETKDLRKLTFGGDAGARIRSRNKDGVLKPVESGAVIGWALSKSEDKFGNEILYKYGEENELKTISYGKTVITFEYDERADKSESFLEGSMIKKRSKRLAFFEIVNDEVVLFTYKFKYNAVGFGGSKRSLLDAIVVCDRNDRCLNPLKFNYEGSSNWKPSFDNIGGSDGRVSLDFGVNQGWTVEKHERFVEDVDGDGWADLVGFANSGVFVGTNKRDGSFEKGKYASMEFGSITWGKEYPRTFADVDGDGLPDIVGFASAGLFVAFNKGNMQFEKAVNMGAMFHYGGGWRVGKHPRLVVDINGDGRADVLGFADGGVFVALSEGRTFGPMTKWIDNYGSGNGWTDEKHIRTLSDVNGDGLLDIVGFGETSVYVSLNDGTSFKPVQNWLANRFTYSPEGWRTNEHIRVMEDVNGDGLADIVGFSCCGMIVSLSDGKKFLEPKYWTSEFGSRVWSKADHPRTLRDVSGDGLPDIVGFANSGTFVAINQGGTFSKATRWSQGFGKNSGWQTSRHPRFLSDVTGDGILDIVGFAASGVYAASGENAVPRITAFTDSFGAVQKVGYKSLPTMMKEGLYKKIEYPDYPIKTGIPAIAVVNSISLYNNMKEINRTNFEYEGLKIDSLGRGLLGFESIVTSSSTSDVYEKETFNSEFPLTGTLRQRNTYLKANGKEVELSGVKSHYEIKTKDVKHIVLTSREVKRNDDAGDLISTTLTKFMDYNLDCGEFAHVHQLTSGNNESHLVETKNIFLTVKEGWLLGLLTNSTVTHESDNQAITKTMEFVHDYRTGAKIKQIQEPRSELGLHTEYTYDSFGNIIKVIEFSSIDKKKARQSTMEFDSYGVQMISRSNALGHKETYKHDEIGNVIESVGPNGVLSKWNYNDIGKLVGEYRADGTHSHWHYKWSQVNGESYRLIKEVQGFSTETEVYDINDRLIRKMRLGMEGNNIVEDIVYNARGFVSQHSNPYFEEESSVLADKYEYDNFNRLVSVKKPYGNARGEAMSTYNYNGLTTTEIDPVGNAKIINKDILGRVISVSDAAGGKSKYKYDPVGNLLEITNPSGHKIITTYDLMGRKTSMNDLHMGLWKYKHNVFGELIWQVDALGNEIYQEYDILGRKVSKKDKDGISTWTYDETNGIGKVAREKSHSGLEKKWHYDVFGREDSVVTTIEDERFEIENVYDDFGRLIVQKFPNGREVHRCYNKNGYLLRVQKYKCSVRISFFWEALAYDANGRVTKEEQGNGVVTSYDYDLADNLVQIKTVGKDGKTTMRTMDYEYDENHNLRKRTKSNTEHDTIETFRYDSIDRLTRATLRTKDGKFGITENWGYDRSGNIVYDNKFGQRHFEYYADKPHAVKQAGSNTYSYDKNGNIIDRNGMKIEWTPDNKPKSFTYRDPKTEKEDTLIYRYDSEGFRYMKQHKDNTTLNIGHLYEVKREGDSTTTSIFVYAHKSGNLIATLKKKSSQPEFTEYIHTDHLGSVEMITNENGTLKQRICYTSFGTRLSCNPSQGSPLPNPLTSKGFTGHDHVEIGGLIHMNGRVYDPEIGRFLSPDPHIQDLYDTQNLNRYSYARNNPLKFDDPSGYFFKKIFRPIKKAVKKVVKFVKKNWKPIVAVVATIATAGALSAPAAALVATTGMTGITATVATGALVGAGSGFVGGTISTGTIDGGLKGALGGAITGGFAAGFSDLDSLGHAFAKATGGGLSAEATGGDFKKGFISAGIASGARYLYNQVVPYDSTWEKGGPAKVKKLDTEPYPGRNNIGIQGKGNSIDTSWFSKDTFLNVKEGGGLSRMLNRVPGINAVAGMHDMFQVSMDRVFFPGAREWLNVPGMPVAAVITYASLLDSETLGFSQYQAMMVDESRKRK